MRRKFDEAGAATQVRGPVAGRRAGRLSCAPVTTFRRLRARRASSHRLDRRRGVPL